MIVFSIALLILAILGAPLFTVIATSAMLGFKSSDTSLLTVPLEFMSIAHVPVLTAIPLFTFAGYLLSECEAPHRLVRVTRALFGWVPGGLAIVCLVVCALFTAFTGASGVTIIALGAILYPALVEDGYSERFTLGLVTSSGSLGLLFAPSLPLILYGVVAQVSIDDLFRAGILPGILMIAALSVYSVWTSRGTQRETVPFSGREVLAAMREAIWELPLPIVVLGGIYSGFFAVSEAAAITALYVFIAEVLINREIALRDLPRIIRESTVLVGAILMILGMSLASTYYMIDMEIPQKLLALVSELFSSQVTFLVLLLVFLLILGNRPRRPVDTAHCGDLRRQPGASRHRFPGGNGTRLPDAPGGAQPVHIELSLRETHPARVLGHVPVPDHSAVVGYPDCILARSFSVAGLTNQQEVVP
jgi:C4-dicarboxylate transporter DctM subunit